MTVHSVTIDDITLLHADEDTSCGSLGARRSTERNLKRIEREREKKKGVKLTQRKGEVRSMSTTEA